MGELGQIDRLVDRAGGRLGAGGREAMASAKFADAEEDGRGPEGGGDIAVLRQHRRGCRHVGRGDHGGDGLPRGGEGGRRAANGGDGVYGPVSVHARPGRGVGRLNQAAGVQAGGRGGDGVPARAGYVDRGYGSAADNAARAAMSGRRGVDAGGSVGRRQRRGRAAGAVNALG